MLKMLKMLAAWRRSKHLKQFNHDVTWGLRMCPEGTKQFEQFKHVKYFKLIKLFKLFKMFELLNKLAVCRSPQTFKTVSTS